MGDFQLREPTLQIPRISGPSLGNFELVIDPELRREIRALISAGPSLRLRDSFLRPNWRQLRQEELDQLLRQPAPTPEPPLVPAGRGPAQPRTAEVADLLSAISAIPAVQTASNRVLNLALEPIRREANNLTPVQIGLLITQGVVMSGGLLAAINLSRNPPEFPLNLLLNRSFPVPGVDGLTLRLEHRGGQIAWSDIGGSGVSAQAGGRSTGERFQGEVSITLDLTRWFPALQ